MLIAPTRLARAKHSRVSGRANIGTTISTHGTSPTYRSVRANFALSASTSGRHPIRLLRWAERLNKYNFTDVYRPGKDNLIPDLLCRAPIPPSSDLSSATPREGTSSSSSITFDVSDSTFLGTSFGPTCISAISKPELAAETSNNANLELVKGYLRDGWPFEATNSATWSHLRRS